MNGRQLDVISVTRVSKSLIFLVKSFLGNFYKHLVTFYWSHCLEMINSVVTATYEQCDQIERFVKVLGYKFFNISCPNI